MNTAWMLPSVALGALALTACGTKTLNSDELEHTLAKQLAPQGGVKPSDIKISCPDDVTVEKGRKFDCQLRAPDGSKVSVKVTLTNDSGHFTATVPR
jgi:hypothetical protein